MELVEQVNVKVDSKGRICIPAEIRKEIGETNGQT
jgi:AbrB family looped-hinge helix DNA binding protein